uniref:WD repeat-containing protein 18 n=1 Tax=Salmo trutta TaxID=8032 RepID=A0A673WLN1_SALTR
MRSLSSLSIQPVKTIRALFQDVSAVLELHSGTNLLYILGAQLGKNFINVWEMQRKDQLQQKIVCPGIVTCLTASPNGLYLVAGIAEAIYFWEVSTGNLLAILNRGKENLALVWSLASVVQLDLSLTPEPRHDLCRHSLPITDIHCGLMGPQSRVATASLDQTVKLWELSSGEMLLSVLFDVGIMSVTLDPCEYYHLFCGGSDGGIFQVSLCSQTFQSDNKGNQVFKGHSLQGKLVTCLSVSMDGTLLLSGSHEETIRLWDIQSKQSIRSINHKGPVTNALIIPAPANMFLPDSRPGIPLPRFSRHLNPLEQGEGTETGGVCLRLAPHTQEPQWWLSKCVFGNGENTKVRVSELEEEERTLKKVNKDLYDFSTLLLTKPS